MTCNILNNFNSILSVSQQRDLKRNFQLAATYESRITFMFKLINENRIFYEDEIIEVKNQIDSMAFRNAGNKFFVSKRDAEEYLQALELYNRSIAFAPINSTQLALGFANRSAVLFHLRKYSEAVRDIDRALNANYPVNLKYKLLLRKTECLALLGSAEFNAVYEETLEWINYMSLNASNKRALKNKLTATRNVRQEKIQDTFDSDIPEISSKNEIPCASDAVALKHNEEFGRHLVATRKIEPGEILVVEKPYALMLATNNLYTHCSYCLKFAWDSIPCEKCIFVLYCSKVCKDRAWEEYHNFECHVVGELLKQEVDKAELLCLRLAILAVKEFGSIENLKSELTKIDSSKADRRTEGFSDDGKLHSDTYRSIYSLTTNAGKRPFHDLFRMTYNAVISLYTLATRTAFFGKVYKRNDFASLLANDDIAFIGGLILRHDEILECNAHQFQDLCISEKDDCGIAIMSFLCLINHSCSGNVCRMVSNGRMVLYALFPIEKDTQLFDNYGKFYWGYTKEERQSSLAENYFFKCKCTPCEENWPLESAMTFLDIESLSSHSDKIKVQEAVIKLTNYSNTLSKFERLADKFKFMENNPNILQDLRQIMSILMQFVPLYSSELFLAMSCMKLVVCKDENRFDVPELKEV